MATILVLVKPPAGKDASAFANLVWQLIAGMDGDPIVIETRLVE